MSKAVFSFLFLVLSFPLSFAQTNNPIVFKRCSYNAYETTRHKMIILPYDKFPWGVCFNDSYDDFSYEEISWAKLAMEIWNVQYNDYVYKRWGTLDMMYIPRGPLFINSCDEGKYNIIYAQKEYLGPGVLAYYYAENSREDNKQFHGFIGMSKDEDWSYINRFINVFVHELGHALGLPHAPINKTWTAIMRPYGFYCAGFDRYGYTKACDLNDYDFEKFLFPYHPENAITRKESNKRLWDNISNSWNMACLLSYDCMTP